MGQIQNFFRYCCFILLIIVFLLIVNNKEGFQSCDSNNDKLIYTIENNNQQSLQKLIQENKVNKKYVRLPRLSFYNSNQPDSAGRTFPIDETDDNDPPPIIQPTYKYHTKHRRKHHHHKNICSIYTSCSDINSINDCSKCQFNGNQCEVQGNYCVEP